MTLSARMSRVAPSPTLRVTAEADRLRRQGIDVVDLGAGEPDFPTPEHIKAAARAAIDANFTKYTPSAGIMELREAICARFLQDSAVEYRTEEVIVTAGGKQALYNAAMALFDEGDEVITHAPVWPTIPEQVKLAGATPVLVHNHAEDGFAIHAQPIIDAITPRTKAIVINSPCNPTGALISETALGAIADAAARRGVWIIADLTYDKLIYESVAHNLPRVLVDRLRDRTILCGAASKAYAMTGWRCGWALGPAPVIAACNAVQGHSTSNVISRPTRQGVGVADRRPALHLRQAARRLLPVPVRRRSARSRRRALDCRFRRSAPARRACRGDGGRRIRCARLLPHFLRNVAGAAARRRDTHPRFRAEARTGPPRRLAAAVAALPSAAAARRIG
jgi:aspartate/methionine/tyrosine aminotransferase